MRPSREETALTKASLHATIFLITLVTFGITGSYSAEVNCYNGSSLSGIEGFDIDVACNPLAEKILFHRSLVRDYALKYLMRSGIELIDQLNPESAMLGIHVVSVEMQMNDSIKRLATTINIDLNRAALCLLEDREFHAISSIVWEEDRLIVSDEKESREFILGILAKSLDNLVEDLRRADPGKYISPTAVPTPD